MVRKTVLAAVAATLLLCGQARAQGEFIAGAVVGATLFGGNQYGAAEVTVLYMAPPEKLREVDPLSVRMAAYPGCFGQNGANGWYYNGTGSSLGQMFSKAVQDLPKENRTILQVVRVFDPEYVQCAAIWFTYVER